MSVTSSTLPGGVKVISESIESVKSITIGAWVKTGSRDELVHQSGITHFLEHMLFKGTEKRTAFDIAQSMESVGGYMNAFTSIEHTCYYIRCLDTDLERAMDVLSDMILHSTFPQEEIEKEKKVVLEEMKMYKDSPEDVIFEEFNARLFSNHPLGRPIIGFEQTVSSFSRPDLQGYINQYYQPDNILIAAAGNLNHDVLLKLADRYFSQTTQHQSSERFREKIQEGDLSRFQDVITRPIEQTHMLVGKRGLPYEHEDRISLLLVNTLLSGGMSSRLHQNIREKYGYCYSVSSFSQSYIDTGLFGVYIGTDKEYIGHVRELIQKEFDELRGHVVSEKEWVEVKAQLKGKLLLAQESMNNRMTRLAKSELNYGRFITLEELVEEIDEIGREDVRSFSEKFLDFSDYSELLLLPEKGA